MNKKFLLLGASIATLFGAKTLTEPLEPIPAHNVTMGVEEVQAEKPTPSKQQAPAPAQRDVTVAARPLPMGAPTGYFIEKPQRRKVKYGNRRWVIV
jgi:hypothetical protein